MFFTKNQDDDTKNIDEVLSNEEFTVLRAEFLSFDLEIQSGSNFEVRYHGPAYRKPELSFDDGTMEINEPDLREKEIKRWEKGAFKLEWNFSGSARVTVTVPKNHPLEEVDLKLKSGDLRLKDFASDELDLESMSGNFKGENLRLGNLDATVNSGNIVLDKVRLDEGEISLTSGNFLMKNSRIMDQMSVATVSGDNVVKDTQVAEANLHTVSGDNRIFGEKMTRGDVGKQDGSFLRMTTVSGDNRIE